MRKSMSGGFWIVSARCRAAIRSAAESGADDIEAIFREQLATDAAVRQGRLKCLGPEASLGREQYLGTVDCLHRRQELWA